MTPMQPLTTRAPRRPRDRTLQLLRLGYRFAPDLRRGAVDDLVETRLLGRRTTIVGGREGVRLFYDETKLRRRHAVPRPLLRTLFGAGAVHGLDDADHRHRKGMFLTLLTPGAARDIAGRARTGWHLASGRWAADAPVSLFDAAVQVHWDAVCEWAGIPAGRVDGRLARDLATIVDGFGGVGPRHVRARRAGRRADRWATALIGDVRSGAVDAPDGSALQIVAGHHDPRGAHLPAAVAAVELLNILRPTVAVAWFVAFSALALHDNPTWRGRLRAEADADLEAFAHEVRRLYPFVPVLGARVRRGFTWRGCRFRRGRLVLLDVYGTNHQPALWADPDRFDPDRYAGRPPDPDSLIPQGGGDAATGHRCPGERVAIELIKVSAALLAGLDYDVPAQDLGVRLSRMPTLPRSGFRIVRRPADIARVTLLTARGSTSP
jgi:fatty-acid peroxygenase